MAIPENNNPINQEALQWLKEAKEPPEAHRLHLLVLAFWGVEEGVEGDWPANHNPAVESQVGMLLGWDPKNVLAWLFSNPEGEEDPKQQEEDLLRLLESTQSPKRAAMHVLNAIYSRMQSVLPALQPAATELSEVTNEWMAQVDNVQLDEVPEIKDCHDCSTHKAVLQFGERAYEGLARKLIYSLQQIDSTGIYGDDYRYKTLWDEYCHEVQSGPHDLLEAAWEHTLHGILDSIVNAIPPHEGALLTISAAWEVDKDDVGVTTVCVAPDLIRENLKRVVDRIAGRREMWRFGPS